MELYDLVRTNLFIPSRFLEYPYELGHLLPVLCRTCKTCRKIHIYIVSAKLLRWNFIKISLLSTGSGVHKLLRQFFWSFRNFRLQFCKKKTVAPPGEENWHCLVHLKGQLLLKK